MGKHRILKELLALLLILGIHANAVMTEACLCGRACSHGLQDGSEAGVSSFFHMRCSMARCKSCSIEEGQTLMTANTSFPTGNVKILDMTCTICVLVDFLSINHSFESIGFSHVYVTFLSFPVYLKTLSLLC